MIRRNFILISAKFYNYLSVPEICNYEFSDLFSFNKTNTEFELPPFYATKREKIKENALKMKKN